MSPAVIAFVGVMVASPLIAYVWAAMRTPQSKVATASGYFIAFRQVGAAPFANSSLAYAFQVATLFPFLYWGAQGQILPAIVNTLAWGAGIAVFRRFLPSVLTQLSRGDSPRTLHGLLGQAYNSDAVRHVAAFVTIVGMLGVALTEAYWGMQVLRVFVKEDDPAFLALVWSALLFVLAYVWYGGTWGSMKTDMLQLVFAYIGFSVVFVFAIGRFLAGPSSTPAGLAWLSILFVLLGVGAIVVRVKYRLTPVSPMDPTRSANTPSEDDLTRSDASNAHDVDTVDGWSKLAVWLSGTTFFAIGVLVACLVVVFFRALPHAKFAALGDPGDPTWVGIAALTVLGFTFQFVDMTAWQRLQSVGGTPSGLLQRCRSGLLLFSIESPFSWILCALLGALLAAVSPDLMSAAEKAGPLAAFPRLMLEAGSVSSVLVGGMFMIAVMGVMLSTIDSALVAAMYAYVADFKNCRFWVEAPDAVVDAARIAHLRREDERDLMSGKRAAVGLILAVSMGVMILGWLLASPDKLIGTLVGFYGGMLALLPAVTLMLAGQAGRFTGRSVAIGIGSGVLVSVGFTLWGLFNPQVSWLSVLLGPPVAAAVPILSRFLRGRA